MKRRAISFITVLALCLSLCPVQAQAAGWEPDAGLCPHHQAHTEECGYAPPVPGRGCAHEHDGNCLAADGSCAHRHDASCGYAAESAGSPCAFVCQACPTEDQAGGLPPSVTPDNENQVGDQLKTAPALYPELPGDGQDVLGQLSGFDLPARPDAAGAPAAISSDLPSYGYELVGNKTIAGSYSVNKPMVFDTCGYSYISSGASTMIVTGTGELYLTTGTIESQQEAGIEVQEGGFLCVENAGMTVIGKTYGVDLSSGARARLSGGTFTGKTAAIRMADNAYGALLQSGCAYFDENGNPLSPAEVAGKKTVMVKECTKHQYTYTPDSSAPAHDGICDYCGDTITVEKCKFSFSGGSNQAECGYGCGHTLTITIDEDSLGDLVYNGTDKPANVDDIKVSVMLDGSAELDKSVYYNVDCTTCADVNDIGFTVTVFSEIYNWNWEFTKTFYVTQAETSITWEDATPVEVNYNGSPVQKFPVTIKMKDGGGNWNNWSGPDPVYSYFYRDSTGSNASYEPGLPTDAGTYDVIARLSGTENYAGSETAPLSVEIKPIPAVITAPVARQLTYNRTAQGLVTRGVVEKGDVVILFASSKDGEYSESIPTGTDAGDYEVWYKADDTRNYTGVGKTKIDNVKILRKAITPNIELEYTTCTYDGGVKEPKVTVRDPEDWEILRNTEYKVTYEANQNVGTATVTVKDKENGNYQVLTNEATFEITLADQAALEITNQPDTVSYGDVFTLGTAGGSGNGTVTWKIIAAKDANGASVTGEANIREIVQIGANSGQVTATGLGTVTVQATKSDGDAANHKDATAVWEFTIGPKHVTATVAAANKTYDKTDTATVTARVEPGDLVSVGDNVSITGNLTGRFSDANAGTDKSVTVDVSGAVVGGDGKKAGEERSAKYIVTIPSTPVRADIISKSVTPTVERTDPTARIVYDGAAKEPAVTVKDVDEVKGIDDVIAPSEYDVVYTNNTNAGWATVRVVGKAGGNYIVNGSTTFEIEKAPSKFIVEPVGAQGLLYKGKPQPLLSVAGVAEGGTIVYTLNGVSSGEVPTGTAVAISEKPYVVSVKIIGDANHKDTETKEIKVTIGVNDMKAPTIELSDYSFRYDGNEHRPSVTIRDDGGDVVPPNEYTLKYNNNKDVGDGTVTITTSDNYKLPADKSTVKFTILEAEQTPLEITGKPSGAVYYGDTLHLGTTGGSGTGGAKWSIEEGSDKIKQVGSGGQFCVIGTGGPIVIKAARTSDNNYKESEAVWKFYADPKPVTAVLTGKNKVYDGNATTTVYAKVDPSDLVSGDSITIPDLTGKFVTVNVGTGIKITNISSQTAVATGTNVEKYEIKYPDFAVADIISKPVTAEVRLKDSTASLVYDNGNKIEPEVVVEYTEDGTSHVIPSTEYTPAYSDNANAGTATVTITAKPGGNYSFGAAKTTFTIRKASQAALSISVPADVTDIRYGGTFQLSTTGGSGTGEIMWTITSGSNVAKIDQSGVVTVTGVGSFTVRAEKAGDSNHEGPVADTKMFEAKQATATLDTPPQGKNLTYNGEDQQLVTGGTATGGELVYSLDGASYTTSITGNEAKTYTIQYKVRATDPNYKDSEAAFQPVTATIEKAQTQFDPNSLVLNGTLYKGAALSTITISGTAKAVIASGEETVDGSFDWVDGSKTFQGTPAEPQEVKFTPTSANYAPSYGLITVTVVDPSAPDDPLSGAAEARLPVTETAGTPAAPVSGADIQPNTENTSVQASVRAGTASAVLNTAAGDKLVDEALAAQSTAVVIKPEITGDVTTPEVSSPASAVSRIRNETDAVLTISTPIADVTIPNVALDVLSASGGTVSIVTEQVENMVVLTLSGDGKDVGTIPGGLTLTVPAEGAGPGTVAVLVHKDGTRETIRWSVAEDGTVRIPLDGSATVEIVDNSKEFTDVPAESWASDAVAFASAHELFNGTGEETFSPEQSMSRAMLATVLYNLEGCPEQSLTGEFSDVNDGAWYASSVSWATANGVTDGYGGGQFGPNDSITREQFAVMLWRYAGTPVTDEQALRFADADQASGYAEQALSWAVANGVMSGHSDGRLDPSGMATRAQAAQMLKNFIENT